MRATRNAPQKPIGGRKAADIKLDGGIFKVVVLVFEGFQFAVVRGRDREASRLSQVLEQGGG